MSSYPSGTTICTINAVLEDVLGNAASSSTGGFIGALSDADIARIAAAVLAALQSTTIPVNVTHFNGNLTQGSGRLGDPVRPA